MAEFLPGEFRRPPAGTNSGVLTCNPLYFKLLLPGPHLLSAHYKGFGITSRTYQIRGTGRWTLDLLISHGDTLRAFTGSATYPNEASASQACVEHGRQIIDGKVRGQSVAELM